MLWVILDILDRLRRYLEPFTKKPAPVTTPLENLDLILKKLPPNPLDIELDARDDAASAAGDKECCTCAIADQYKNPLRLRKGYRKTACQSFKDAHPEYFVNITELHNCP